MTGPRILIRTQLDAGAKLCLLRLSRVKAESLIDLGDELVLYPCGTLQPNDFRVVSYARHGLRLHSMALEAADDTAKFISI